MATKLTSKESIEQIIAEMTVEEKARIVIGGSPFGSEKMEKYGIPSMTMFDSCNGLNEMEYAGEKIYKMLSAQAEEAGAPLDREQNGYMGGLLLALGTLQKKAIEKKKAGEPEEKKIRGVYPPGISYGATWNPKLVEECSSALARELGSYGVDMVLGPNINIHRDPRCGRLAESVSEDPCLVSKIAVAEVNGIQKEGMIACAKHFAANNQEKDRLGVAEHVPERALREIYLPGFKATVDAGVGSLMSAYNKLNGKPSAMNDYLLTDILREEWGFNGFVVSDWGASYEQVPAVAAGTDLTMPGPRGVRCIEKAVADGTLPMEKLDNCVRHFLTVLLDSTAMTGNYPVFKIEETIEIAEQVARDGMILLKNDGTLPLSQESDVVFYGRRSKEFTSSPEGSSKAVSDLVTNPFARAVELLGEEHVLFETASEKTKYWIVVAGINGQEGTDQESLSMDEEGRDALERAITEAKAAEGKVILIVNAAGPVDLSDYEKDINAILCPFFAGMQGGKASTDAVFGLYNPSGKLPLTWPKRCCDMPAFGNYPGENKEVWYGEGMYVGYRWYDARRIPVAYPFGYGLSYTTFELSDLKVPETVNVDNEEVCIQVKVKNTGAVAGSEVVQVYVHDEVSKIEKPYKQLKGFKKVFLEPGEEKNIEIVLNKEDFSAYSLEWKEWITEPGMFELLVGTSAEDLPMSTRVMVKCRNPFGYGDRTGIGAIVKDPRSLEALNKMIDGDIRNIAHVAIEYGPDTPFVEIWNGKAMQAFFQERNLSSEEIQDMRQKLQEAFDEIEI